MNQPIDPLRSSLPAPHLRADEAFPRSAAAALGNPVTAPDRLIYRAGGPYLTAFDDIYAARVASWVRSWEELIWLAPATPPPLSAEKIMAWGRDRPDRYLYWSGDDDGPCAYAELNIMAEFQRQRWVGHFLVDPAVRGRGLGVAFMHALLDRAFAEYAAEAVSLVVFPGNMSAIRCYQKAGFVELGTERKFFESTRQSHDFLRMGIDLARYRKLARGRRGG